MQARNGSIMSAPLNLDHAEDHATELSKCEKQLSLVAGDCEKICSSLDRSRLRAFLDLQTDFHTLVNDQL